MTIQQARKTGRQALVSSPTPELDTDCLLSHILSCDKTTLLFHREKILDESQENKFLASLEKRKTGLPIAYITGHREFFGFDFLVTQDVLIPKPDTELLVEKSLECIEEKTAQHPERILTICDMCTGSGCVGLSIFKAGIENRIFQNGRFPIVTLVDISPSALEVALKNLSHLNLSEHRSNFRFVRSNLFETVTGSFDLIVSNPPYIPGSEAKSLLNDGRAEPLLALDGDVALDGSPSGSNDGLGIMRNLVPQTLEHLSPHGTLIVESGEYNAEATRTLFINEGFLDTCIHRDLSGQLRDIQGHI